MFDRPNRKSSQVIHCFSLHVIPLYSIYGLEKDSFTVVVIIIAVVDSDGISSKIDVTHCTKACDVTKSSIIQGIGMF